MHTVELGDVCDRIDYGFTASADFSVKEPRLLRITDIQNGAVDWNHVPGCKINPEEEAENSLAIGDIVFARTGATTGKSFLIEYAPRAVFASYLIRLRTSRKVLPQYLYAFCQSERYWHQIRSAIRGAAQGGVNSTTLSLLRLPLPDLSEQRRIAARLEHADRLRRTRRYALELSDDVLPAAFLELFGDPGKNSIGWEQVTLDEVAGQITDGEHATPRRSTDGIKLLSARNIQNGSIDLATGIDFIPQSEFERIRKRCWPKIGDVLMSCSGTIGRVATITKDEPLSLVRSVALIRPDRERIVSRYLEFYLRTAYMQGVIRLSANQSSQANIFTGPIKELPCLVPPLPLQQRFAALVQRVELLRAVQRESLRQAEHLFASLLHGAFHGES
jgi:type I restriction enzyme, S subunit